jgi:hypothetical protein
VISSTSSALRPAAHVDLHNLSLSLAREREVIAFARALASRLRAPGRLPRIAAVFSFVAHLVDVPSTVDGEPRDGVDVLLALAGEREGPALILSALLLAVGERAFLAGASDRLHVRVEVEPEDLARLPPHAQLSLTGGRYYVPLDPCRARSPLGFLPRTAREALASAAPDLARRQPGRGARRGA